MSEMITVPQDEWLHLQARLKKMAAEKIILPINLYAGEEIKRYIWSQKRG